MLHAKLGLRRYAFAALCCASIGLPASALAAPPTALDRAGIALGGYFVGPDIKLGLNTQSGSANSGEVSTHRLTLPRAHAEFLLGDRHGFALDYYGFYRNYSDTLNRPFSIAGTSGNLNLAGNAEVGLDVGNAAYRWWFGSDTDVFGLGIGAAYYRIQLNANAATAVNNSLGSFGGSYSNDAYAPLLQVGWRHGFDPNLRMYLDASGVRKNGGALSGHIYNASLGAEWYPLKHLGLGAEYGVTRVRIDDTNSGANLDMKLDGPTVFLKARF